MPGRAALEITRCACKCICCWAAPGACCQRPRLLKVTSLTPGFVTAWQIQDQPVVLRRLREWRERGAITGGTVGHGVRAASVQVLSLPRPPAEPTRRGRASDGGGGWIACSLSAATASLNIMSRDQCAIFFCRLETLSACGDWRRVHGVVRERDRQGEPGVRYR